METTNYLLLLSLILLIAAFSLGAIDGVFFHLQRYRLFAHAESRSEHCLHTVRAWLILPTVLFLYLLEPAGPLLVAAAVAVAADLVVLLLDLLAEQHSRRKLGGLSHAEYMVHVASNGLHSVAVALAFASRPLDAWTTVSSPLTLSALPPAAHWLVSCILVMALGGAIQHVLLLRAPSFARAATPSH